MTTTIVLTEIALGAADAAHLAHLHEEADQSWVVLVLGDPHRSLLADVLDHLSLLELREALDAVRGHDESTPHDAEVALEASVAELEAVGISARGEVVAGRDPIKALAKAVETYGADDVVIVTKPHAVEDTFHTDWASKARETLGVPVLHVYAGSTWLN